MPVPTDISELNTTAALNYPQGTESPRGRLDDYLRTLSAFIAQLRNGKLNKSGDTMTGNLNIPSLNGGPLAGTRNHIINGNFNVNQDGNPTASTVYGAGVYVRDGFKAGASGCTVSFATVENITTATITAGSLIQIIEGLNLQSGTHALSWQGSAQGKIGAGAYAASGVTGAVIGGTNLALEFNTGTLAKVQLEQGTVATPFEQRPFAVELSLCQRYWQRLIGAGLNGVATDVGSGIFSVHFLVPMRANPTMTRGMAAYTAGGFVVNSSGGWLNNPNPVLSFTTNTQYKATLQITGFTTAMALGYGIIFNTPNAIAFLDARL